MTAPLDFLDTRPRPRHRHWTLGNMMTIVAIGAVAVGLCRSSLATVSTLALPAGLFLGPLFMARKGLKFIDIAAVTAIALLTIGFMVPAIHQAGVRTGGRKNVLITRPVKLHSWILRDR
jgi:hypothetical protein